jgi:GT2 family glycosyltransferase
MSDAPSVRPAARLSTSVVVYRPALEELRDTLVSFAGAVRLARASGVLGHVALTLVDNGTPDTVALDCLVAESVRGLDDVTVSVLRGHGNVGYGRGHNLAIRSAESDHHLVLNPDVIMDAGSLTAAIDVLAREPSVGLVAPQVRGPSGERQYLCRRYPDLLTLFVRGFAPPAVQRRFERRLSRYEMRDVLTDDTVRDVPIASGCFMYTRTAALQQVGGFSEEYFLYFEDYDLSLRMARHARIAYVPDVRIVHAGGGASRKGSTHVRLYLSSALRFFRTHGWKWR